MKIPLQVEIRHPSFNILKAATSDMSDGGIFVVIDEGQQPEEGESVLVRTLGLGPTGEESGPPVVMSVVRKSKHGMGLVIEKTASANLASWCNESASQHVIFQSLFLYNQQHVLFVMQGDHWRLPSRQLLAGESWQQGITALLSQLSNDCNLPSIQDVQPHLQCFPLSRTNWEVVDLVTACTLRASPGEIAEPFQWVSSSEITEIATYLDSEVVDYILMNV